MTKIYEELKKYNGKKQRVTIAYDVCVALVTEVDEDHPNMSKNLKMFMFDPGTQEITEEIDLDKSVEEMVEIFASKINVKEFLRQTLHESGVMQLAELAKFIKKHPDATMETKNKRGCLYLQVPNPDPGASDFKLFLKD